MKCEFCGSYNTVREKGALVRRDGRVASELEHQLGPMEQEEEEEDQPLLLAPEPMEGAHAAPDTPPETPTRPQSSRTSLAAAARYARRWRPSRSAVMRMAELRAMAAGGLAGGLVRFPDYGLQLTSLYREASLQSEGSD